MEWWQSLLISIATAFTAGFFTWFISYNQLKNARNEFKQKFLEENRQYISRVRLDKEFAIYQELSEKFITMVMDVGNLFPDGTYYEPQDEKLKEEYYKKVYSVCEDSFQDANKAINKYAIFIPKKWYDKFIEIKKLCYLQIRYFYDFKVIRNINVADDMKRECFQRTTEIKDSVEKLIKELRAYLEELDTKEK